ncbi:MAG: hypothetical protein LBG07_10730 [Treponema sp.]|jgi:hypothetical protein|nr:hypothetical protein [Treponema sp.]
MPEGLITIREAGEILEFSPASLYAYCGPGQIIASALMFRLFERAFRDLSPELPPDREDIQFLAGFPGTGIAECVELVTRIRTRHPERFTVDPLAPPPEAPLTASGALYFEVQVGERRRGYWPPGALFDDVFRKNVGLYQDGGGTVEEQKEYLSYKKRLSAAILRFPDDGFFSFRSVAAKARPS